jgi:D-glycero-D-manno-heptose 1,7-bisphosphate phosphatase
LKRNRAIFVDRDGVLNDLVYDKKEGRLSSPVSARELRVFPFVAESVKKLREMGYLVIVISNQPGVAKRQFTRTELERMNAKIRRDLASKGTSLDGEYYCLHSPDGLVKELRISCDCRKPKPGLLLRAAREMDIDLARSYFVGDGLIDVEAGKKAGCRTILVGHMTTFLSKMIEERKATPDYMVHTLKDVPALLSRLQSQ